MCDEKQLERRASESRFYTLKFIRAKKDKLESSQTLVYILLSLKTARDEQCHYVKVEIIPLVNSTFNRMESGSTALTAPSALNKFSAIVHINANKVVFSVNGLEEYLQGHGIGTYAFNELVRWLKEHYPNHKVVPIDPPKDENLSDASIERRNQFFMNFGFAMQDPGGEQSASQESSDDSDAPSEFLKRNAIFAASSVAELGEHSNTGKIEELDLEEFLTRTVSEKNRLEVSYTKLKREVEEWDNDSIFKFDRKEMIKLGLFLFVAAIVLLGLAVLR